MSCPVCFNAGMADDTVRTSINLGIGVMLTVTAVVLAGFLRFIVSIVHRSRTRPAEAGRSRDHLSPLTTSDPARISL